jgi:hypothetical protein
MSAFDVEQAFQRMFGELDGRLKRPVGEKYGSAGPARSQMWEPVHCYCGAFGGFVTKGSPILYVCDKCTETIGRLPLPEVISGDPNYWPNEVKGG